MKKFIITLLIFLTGFFLVDKLLIGLRNAAPNREADKRMEQLYKGDINQDIIILGSSRGARDIIASQIEDSLKISTRNFSFPGSGVEFHDYLLSLIIKNAQKKPRLIILNVDDPNELNTNASRLKFRYDLIYPQVKYQQALDKLVADGEKNYWLSKMFVAHQMSMSNLDLRKQHFEAIDTVFADGSMPIASTNPKFDTHANEDQSVYDIQKETKEGLNSFIDIITACQKNNIKLLICFPPNFYKKTIGFEERIFQIVDDKAMIFVHDPIKYPFSKEIENYYDDVHLQRKGAVLFTDELINFLKNAKILN